MSKVLSLQASGEPRQRLIPESLTLTAACVWLINGLNARPDDGTAARALMDVSLPITELGHISDDVLAYNPRRRTDDQDEDEEESSDDDGQRTRVAYNPYGCVFLRRIMVGDVPRLRIGGPVLPVPAFKYWFGGKTYEEICNEYRTTGVIPREALAQTRVVTNRGRMPLYTNPREEPDEDLFSLGASGHTLPPAHNDDGSDIEERDTPPPSEAAPTIDNFLTTLYRQFVIDVLGKSPVMKGNTNPSYVKLSTVERRSGKDDPFRNLTLSDIFVAVSFKRASTDEWKRAFYWFFPPPGFKTTTRIQNYLACPYFKTWLQFLEDAGDNTALIENARDSLWKVVKEWSWIPHAQQDKMWVTSTTYPGFTRWPSLQKPAPRILLRERADPSFVTQGGESSEEEEEE